MLIISAVIALGSAVLSLLQRVSFMGETFPYSNVWNMSKALYEILRSGANLPYGYELLLIFTMVVLLSALSACVGCLMMLIRRTGTQNFVISAFLCIALVVYVNYQLRAHVPTFNGQPIRLGSHIFLKELAFWGAGYVAASVLSFLGNRKESHS